MGRVIREVTGDRRAYMPLLLIADEQEDMVERYIALGTMYVMEEDGRAVGECLLTDEGGGVCEIKNIAVAPECRGRGYGREMIEFALARCAGKYGALQVGTGDSPLTVPFYEKCGFKRHHVVPDFFTDNYDHPIVECGVLLRDMVYLRRDVPRDLADGEGKDGEKA